MQKSWNHQAPERMIDIFAITLKVRVYLFF